MNLGQLFGGAGVVAGGWRKAEEAERMAQQNQLAIEEKNRLDQLRREMLQAPTPEARVPLTFAGQDEGILPVQYIEPVSAPAAPAAPATPAAPTGPQVKVQPPPALPYGQDVANPLGSPRVYGNAQELVRMREMRVKDVQTGLDSLLARNAPARMVENQKQLLAREQGLLDAARQGMQRVEPTVPFGLEGRNVPAPISTDPTTMFAGLEQRYNLPAGLLNAVMMTESGGRPGQTSKAGAQGYFQFMPKTAKQYGVTVNDLGSEAEGAARMLSDLLKMTGGDLNKALAGYNWGIGNVQRRGMEKLPAETRNYIPKVMAYMQQPAAPGAAPAAPTAAAPAAPGLNIPGISSAQAATAAETPTQIEVGGTSDYYLSSPKAIGEDMRRAMQMREETARLAGMYQRAGMGAQFMETRAKLMELDNNMVYLQGMQGLQEFTLANDPRRLAAVWSQYAGVPVGIQPRTDGKFNIIVNGKRTKEGVSADSLTNSARLAFDQTYRQQQAAAGAEYNKERFKASLDIQKNQATQLSQMIREIAVERVKGNNAQALEWAKSNYGWDIKPTGAGDGTVIIRAPGSPPYLFNPKGTAVEIDGVKIQSNAAYPIAGLPSYGGMQAR
jgi:soluble lytic murein transglycosylase-like protein